MILKILGLVEIQTRLEHSEFFPSEFVAVFFQNVRKVSLRRGHLHGQFGMPAIPLTHLLENIEGVHRVGIVTHGCHQQIRVVWISVLFKPSEPARYDLFKFFNGNSPGEIPPVAFYIGFIREKGENAAT